MRKLDPENKRSVHASTYMTPVDALRLERIRRKIFPPPTMSTVYYMALVAWIEAKEKELKIK